MKRFFAVFIVAYAVFLLYMMFFGSGRDVLEISYIQSKPFITIKHFFVDHVKDEDFIINIFGNIFLFCPFGWLGLCIKQFNYFVPLKIFFLMIISGIEMAQYLTGRGIADIDDILLNTIGMLTGFLIYKYVTKKNIADINVHFNLNEEK